MHTSVCPKLPTLDLQSLVESAQLPGMPAATLRLLKICAQRNATIDAISESIGNDPKLAARVVSLANEDVTGKRDAVTTIPQAAAKLGLPRLRSLALSLDVVSLPTMESGMPFDYIQFWRYSLTCATAGRLIARQRGTVDPEEGYLAGLLQDLGVLVLQCANPQAYGQVRREKALSQMRLFQKERELLGYDHTDVGAAFAAYWRLPIAIGNAIRKSHAPDEHELSQICFLADLVHRALYDGRASVESDAQHALRQALAGDMLILPRMQVELARINRACECPQWTEESVADLKQRIAQIDN
jgi:HD-like signal output (HDOD) protein